jgi:hypothetical protein
MIYTAYLQVMFLAGKYGVHPATLSLIALTVADNQVLQSLNYVLDCRESRMKLKCNDSVSQHVTAS